MAVIGTRRSSFILITLLLSLCVLFAQGYPPYSQSDSDSAGEDTEAAPVSENEDTKNATVSENEVSESEDTEKAPVSESEETGKAPVSESEDTEKGPVSESEDTQNAPVSESEGTEWGPVSDTKNSESDLDSTMDCVAMDGLEQVMECDNLNGQESLDCTFDGKLGVTGGTPSADGKTYSHLLESFQHLSDDPESHYDWSLEPPATFAAETTQSSKFTAQPGKITRLYQVMGHCGPYTIHSSEFKQVTGNFQAGGEVDLNDEDLDITDFDLESL